MQAFDVVIIGAGLAGLQCARLLARKGATVMIADRKDDLGTGIRTTGILVRKTLEDFPFPNGTLGRAIRKVTLYSPNLRSLTLTSRLDEFRIGRMDAIYRALQSECEDLGVVFQCGARYASSIPSDLAGRAERDGVPSSKTSGEISEDGAGKGRIRGSDECRTIIRLELNEGEMPVSARVLIGADGVGSRVAKDLGLDENKEWIVGYEEVLKDVTQGGEPALHCFLSRKFAPGYIAWIADDGEECHLGVGGYPSKFDPRESLEAFKKSVAAQFIDLSGSRIVETRAGRIPVGGILKKISNKRGLLVGDAAGAVSPLTAGGLDPCLRLSEFAAAVVSARLADGDPNTLLNYSGEMFRTKFFSRLVMRWLLKTSSTEFHLEVLLRALSGYFGKGFARRIFFRRRSFPGVRSGILQKLQDADPAPRGRLSRPVTEEGDP